ncbi:MAG TPA: cell division protein ZapA [Bdellovibrionota bacterium]|jgi:cell division protein ZapA (FtsZ GTPase activity inhibitor)|nr:cell division protein ZapA [Bdellovibrionota bacterium]
MSETAAPSFLPKGSAKITDIAVGGTQVRVKTDATPTLLKRTKELVESKFDALADKTVSGLTPHQLSVLVALNLAEELLEAQEKLRVLKREVTNTTERLLVRVEAHLAGGQDA